MIRRREIVLGGLASASLYASGSAAPPPQGRRYIGELILRPLDGGRLMQLVRPFGYQDAAGRRWQAPDGAYVDGASIPRFFWSVIGGPFEGRYRNASVIHDWYCAVRVRKWEDTHRVFHEAMLTSQVDPNLARLMFLAVWYGGPSWDELTRRNMVRLTDNGRFLPPSPPPPPPAPLEQEPPPAGPEPIRPRQDSPAMAFPMFEEERWYWSQRKAARDAWEQRRAAAAAERAARIAAEEAQERQKLARFNELRAKVERDNLSPSQIERLVERTGRAQPTETW